MMTPTEAAELLTYIAAWDNRRVSADIARVWADGMPEWMTRDIGIVAARRYFTEASAPSEGTYLSPKILIWYAQRVRRDQAAEGEVRLSQARSRLAAARADQMLDGPRAPRVAGMAALTAQLTQLGKDPS